jgi:hypothetical protein
VTRLSRDARQSAGLFVLLCAIYFASYHGQVYSTDELMLFDSARSFLREGSFALAYTSDLVNPITPPGLQPVPESAVAPLQVYAVAPLIWMATHLPGIGLMHSAWLFNVLVTALAAVVLHRSARALGYSDRASLIVALIFGLATFAWAYSQTFFRDPLLMLMVLVCLYAAEQGRQAVGRRRQAATAWFIVAALAYIAAAATKDIGLLVLPALLIVAVPGGLIRWLSAGKLWHGILLAGLVLGGLLIGALVVAGQPAFAGRLGGPAFFERYVRYAPEALAAYLFSPGFSVWAFSPALLIGLPGALRLLRKGRLRQFLAPLMVLGMFAVAHATIHGEYWYGGLGWGPRFLLPATPFLALWLLPIIDPLIMRADKLPPAIRRWSAAGLALVVVISASLQIMSVLAPVRVFSDFLYSEGQRIGQEIVPWREGVWDVRYIPQVVVAKRLSEVPLAPAWASIGGTKGVLLLCGATAGLGALILTRQARGRLGLWTGVLAALIGLVAMFATGLRVYYHDPRYGGDDESLWRVMVALREGTRPTDAVILGNPTYRPFFMNYYKGQAPVYALPHAPGEIRDPDAPPEVVSDSMDERAHPVFQIMLARIAAQTAQPTARWWFLTEYSPFSVGRYRVTEHFLARHYFPADTLVDEPGVRLLRFVPAGAPPDQVPPWPEIPVRADFGAAALVGVDLPRGTTILPGEALPISLLWRHDGWPADLEPFDYSVNVTLIDRDGLTRAQRAGTPLGSFGHMSAWVPGGYYRDNHALLTPEDLPSGEYDVWVLVFDWRTGEPLPLRDGSGTHVVIATLRVE